MKISLVDDTDDKQPIRFDLTICLHIFCFYRINSIDDPQEFKVALKDEYIYHRFQFMDSILVSDMNVY